MAKVLVADLPNALVVESPWNEATQQQYGFDKEDVAYLESDNVLWRSEADYDEPVAYSLEDEDEDGSD